MILQTGRHHLRRTRGETVDQHGHGEFGKRGATRGPPYVEGGSIVTGCTGIMDSASLRRHDHAVVEKDVADFHGGRQKPAGISPEV